MKRLFIISTLLFSAVFYANSQHHIEGSNFIEVGGGITKHGYFGDVNYDKQLKSKLFLKVGLLADFGKLEESKTNYSTFMFNSGLFYNLFNLGHKVYFNAGGGLALKYDNVNAFEGAIKESSLNYGGFVGGEAEAFFSDSFAVCLNGYQNLYAGKSKSVLGESKSFYVGLGLKFKL